MLSYDEQLQRLLDGDEKIRILTAAINDPLISDEQKLQYRRRRAVTNYERKKWHDVLLDIHLLEQNNDNALSYLKLATTIQEFFRNTRASIVQMMDDEYYTSKHDELLWNINPSNIDALIDGQMVIKPPKSNGKSCKRLKE